VAVLHSVSFCAILGLLVNPTAAIGELTGPVVILAVNVVSCGSIGVAISNKAQRNNQFDNSPVLPFVVLSERRDRREFFSNRVS
jgi:hypothetical protein